MYRPACLVLISFRFRIWIVCSHFLSFGFCLSVSSLAAGLLVSPMSDISSPCIAKLFLSTNLIHILVISVLVKFVLSVLFCSLTFAEYRTKPSFTVRLTSSISYLLIALNPMNCSEFYCLVLLHNVPCIISQHR